MTFRSENRRYDFEVRRVFLENEANEIRLLQQNSLEFFNHYPDHNQWLDMALREVIDGKRIAFGVYRPVINSSSRPLVRLVGSVILKEEVYGNTVEMKNLFIAKDSRGYGFGAELCNIAEKSSSRKGYTTIRTEVPGNETNTVSFLLNRGYQVLITKESPYKIGERICEMYKILPPLYSGDPFDSYEFFSWLLKRVYGFSNVDVNEGANSIDFSLGPKLPLTDIARNDEFALKGTLLVSDSEEAIDKEAVIRISEETRKCRVVFLYGRSFTADARNECGERGIILFDAKSVSEPISRFFAYKLPQFEKEDIAGIVVSINPEYFERMKTQTQPFTYFKGGSIGKYLRKNNKVLFFCEQSSKHPVGGVKVYGDVVEVYYGSAEDVWSECKDNNPVFTESEYRIYVENKHMILAIRVDDLKWISPMSIHELKEVIGKGLDLEDIGHFYISQEILNRFYDRKKQAETSSISEAALFESVKEIPKKDGRPTIGIITALPEEYAAVEVMLKSPEHVKMQGARADWQYLKGDIPATNGGKHCVVLSLVGKGTNIAAARATLLLEHFPNVRSIIMIGIAGGVPYPGKPNEHVRLGDVVVSDEKGVIQYDFVKEEINETTARHPPRPPSAALFRAVRLLKAAEIKGDRPWLRFIEEVTRLLNITRPNEETDVLVSSTDQNKIVRHPHDSMRRKDEPRIFIGPIASANTLLKDPLKRDKLRNRFGVKAVEMEASGIADATWDHDVGLLVVRGVCDYCDSRKGDEWQKYAAVVAAGYTVALIESLPA